MNIDDLTTFITLTKTRNFTQTANKLFVAQSTVTSRINELEKKLNVKLFLRNNRMVELTPAGHQFLEYAEKIIEITEKAVSEITSSTSYSAVLRIGAADSIYETHLSSMILSYTKRHRDYAVKISIGQSAHLIDLLCDGILDIIFSYLPLKKANYICDIFHKDNMILVTDSSNEFYSEGISCKDLLNVNYLMCNFALQDVGQYIRSLFPSYYQFSLEIDDCSKIIPYLIGEKNATFLPEDMAAPFIKDGSLKSIPLLDFNPPVINSYIISEKSKHALWD